MDPVVYILKSLRNGRYYVGSSVDINRRFEEHCLGLVKATRNLRPLGLVFKQGFESIKTARQIEYKIKQKKSRVIIEKIINEGKIGFIK